MGEFDTSFSCSSLLCQETEEACLFETDTENDESIYSNYYKSYFISDNEKEYIEKLVERETNLGFKTNSSFSDCSITSKSWLECARLDAIKWIFNVCFCFKLGFFLIFLFFFFVCLD